MRIPRLFRADVLRSSNGGTRTRDGHIGRPLGEAHICQLHPVLLIDQNIAGLDITVDDALLMRVDQRSGRLHPQIENSILRETPPLTEHLLQRLPVNEFHHEEVVAALLPEVITRDDIGMAELRHDPGFAPESINISLVPGERWLQDLQSNQTVEPLVARFEDRAHRPGTDPVENLIVRKRLCEGHPSPSSSGSIPTSESER